MPGINSQKERKNYFYFFFLNNEIFSWRTRGGRGSRSTVKMPHVLKTNSEIYEIDFGQHELLLGIKSMVIGIHPELTHLSLNPFTICCACISFKIHVIPKLHITFFLFTFMSYYHKVRTVTQDQTKHLSSRVSCFWQQPGGEYEEMSSV